jgi:hypothetical protein
MSCGIDLYHARAQHDMARREAGLQQLVARLQHAAAETQNEHDTEKMGLRAQADALRQAAGEQATQLALLRAENAGAGSAVA